MKKCVKCGILKPKNEFYKDQHTGDKLYRLCISCTKIKNKKWREDNLSRSKELGKRYRTLNPQRIREDMLLRRYGITSKDYDTMLKNQNYKCKICGRLDPKKEGQRYFGVDHDHKTGKVRGLLCSSCNSLIGLANDNVFILLKAIEYLKENSEYGKE